MRTLVSELHSHGVLKLEKLALDSTPINSYYNHLTFNLKSMIHKSRNFEFFSGFEHYNDLKTIT